MHIKRKSAPVIWGVPRKGTKYLVRSSHEVYNGIPLIIVLRDLLKQVENTKEAKKVIADKKIQINSKEIRDLKYPVMIFDSLSFPQSNKHFRAVIKNKRVSFIEINESQSKKRVYRILNKKVLKNKKIQLNLDNGKNILVDKKFDVGDFVIFDNKANKILEAIKVKVGLEMVAVEGKHLGKTGFIQSIEESGEKKILNLKNKKTGEEFQVDLDNGYLIYRDE